MTEKYCLDRGIPFPSIEVLPEDLEEPRECYLFAKAKDPRSPIVLHFPLVNRTFCTHLAPGEGRPWAGVWLTQPRVVVGCRSDSGFPGPYASWRAQVGHCSTPSRPQDPHWPGSS